MRISDWSSDVCSSDLSVDGRDQPEISRVRTSPMIRPARTRKTVTTNMTAIIVARVVGGRSGLQKSPNGDRARSEARSFGAVVPAGSPFAKSDDTRWRLRSEEHTSELQSLMRHSYAVFCLQKKNKTT